MHCEWGVVAGWERALFFKPDDDFVDQHSYRFTPAMDIVAREVEGIVEGVGMMEVSGFNRYEIKGHGAGDFLDTMICGAMPKNTGQVRLCYLLTEKGNILSEATITRLGEDHYWYGSAAASEWHDRDWLNRYKPDSVNICELAGSYTTLVIAGPRSRELLQSVSPRCDWSEQAFPWMRAKQMFIGHAQVLAMSVSFSGELSYELHVPNEQLYLVWKILDQAGKDLNLVYFGLYATESMRVEKGYLHWKADLIYEYNPIETGLDRFVRLDKPDFIGRKSLLRQIDRGLRKRMVSMAVDCNFACAHSGAPVFAQGQQVGSVTSSGFGHRINRNIAFAFIDPDKAKTGTELQIGILGENYPARVIDPVQYDPDNLRVRG